MKKTRLLGAACACVFALAAPHIVWAVPISVIDDSIISRARDNGGSIIIDSPSSTTIPLTTTLTATAGDSSSITNVNYSGTANSATLSWDMLHTMDNTNGLNEIGCCSYAGTRNNTLVFTADVDAIYEISGFYNTSGLIATETILDVYLLDITFGGHTLFEDYSESYFTPDESFVLGDAYDADEYNSTVGSLTGNLIAGHSYEFMINASLAAFDRTSETEAVTNATGNITLNITATTVPIPAAVWLFGSGLLGLIGVARRKKSA